MKTRHARNIFVTAVSLFFILYAITDFIAIPAYKEFLVTSCETLELDNSSCVETSESSAWTMDAAAFMGSAILSAILASPVYILLAAIYSLFKKKVVSEELKKYGYDYFVYHLIESSNGDMTKVEERLMDIPDKNENKRHFIEQYIETLPAEDHDAAVKRLIPN